MKQWWNGLSVRSANVLQNYLIYKTEFNFNSQTVTQEQVKEFLTNLITNEAVQVKRMRNAGVVVEKEVMAWLGLNKDPLYQMPVSKLVERIRELEEQLAQTRREAFHAGYQSNIKKDL